MVNEDLKSEEAALKGDVEISTDTVKIQKLPEKEFARVQSSPPSGSLVEKFEGAFYWWEGQKV